MAGFEQAYKGRALGGLPARLIEAMSEAGGASISLRVRNGEQAAIVEAFEIIADPDQPLARRATYVSLFGEIATPDSVEVMLRILDQEHEALRRAALTSLRSYEAPEIGARVLDRHGRFEASTREVARTLLASRAGWSRQLVAAVDSGQIDAAELPTELVANMRLHQDRDLLASIDRLWGKLRAPTPEHLRTEIRRVKAALAAGNADPYSGKPLFLERCATCHRLFADGGDAGPDLTGFLRRDLDNMLLSIIDPDAEVREGYENHVVWTGDGRVITGFKEDEDEAVLVIRGVDGQSVSLAREGIDEVRVLGTSPMPKGLLDDWSDQQLRDFFAYFRTTQPLVGEPPRAQDQDE